MRMLLLLFPEPLGHFANIAAAFLGDAGSILTYFLNYRIDIHGDTSYFTTKSSASCNTV